MERWGFAFQGGLSMAVKNAKKAVHWISCVLGISLAALLQGCIPPQPPPPSTTVPHWQLRINPFPEPADPGVGTHNVGVVSTRWSFEFTNGDHHLREHGLRVESVHLNWGDCWVYWFSRMKWKNDAGF